MTAPTYRVVAGAPPATLDDALRVFNELNPVCNQHGFLLALYGSVLRPRLTRSGWAADIDMIAVPIRPMLMSEAEQLVTSVCIQGYTEIGRPHRGNMNTLAVALKSLGTGQIVDLQIREIGTQPVSSFFQFSQETSSVREIKP
jgi:hypothetical protein